MNFNGHAFIQGISPSGATVAVGGYAKVFVDSVPISHRATMSEHIGANGLTAAFVHTNEYVELGITFRPASSVSKADGNAQAKFLPKGSTVTLSGFRQVTISDADIMNGDWILMGDATLTLNANEQGTVDLTLRRYLNAEQMTLLKTQVPAGS